MSLARVRAAHRLRGEVQLPGDKGISHRALLLNAVAGGPARVEGLSDGADVASTASCLRALGVEIESGSIQGVGLRGLREPAGPLDCGNSGSTMRLLAGLLAGQPFASTLLGDESLSRRPMDRIALPLRLMGAKTATSPLRVRGGDLHGIEYQSPVASAQVKSALLLAGLYARGETSITSPAPTRDHTERMLRAMGLEVKAEGARVALRGPVEELRPLDVVVPGDLSSAAFWLVAGGLHPNACLTLPAVLVNPTRAAALLQILARAGIEVRAEAPRQQGGEPVADLAVGSTGEGRSFDASPEEVAAAIDELPVLAVAAAVLPGRTCITGAAELRVKECDRIAAMSAGLRAMGANVRELPDGWEIQGPARLEGARVSSAGDHRVAMALAIAGLLASGETEIEGAESVAISYPAFWDHLEALSE